MLQLVEIGARVRQLALGLFVGRAEFLTLEAHQNLPFFYLVALFHPNPLQAARHLGVHVDGVMRHDVARSREHGAARVIASGFRGGADDIDLG